MPLFASRKGRAAANQRREGDVDDLAPEAFRAILGDSFGLTLGPGPREQGWLFTGSVDDTLAPQLSSAAVCLATIDELAASMQLEHVCVVTGSPSTLLVLSGAPPLAIKTALDPRGTAEVIASLSKGARQIVHCEGAWLVQL